MSRPARRRRGSNRAARARARHRRQGNRDAGRQQDGPLGAPAVSRRVRRAPQRVGDRRRAGIQRADNRRLDRSQGAFRHIALHARRRRGASGLRRCRGEPDGGVDGRCGARGCCRAAAPVYGQCSTVTPLLIAEIGCLYSGESAVRIVRNEKPGESKHIERKSCCPHAVRSAVRNEGAPGDRRDRKSDCRTTIGINLLGSVSCLALAGTDNRALRVLGRRSGARGRGGDRPRGSRRI